MSQTLARILARQTSLETVRQVSFDRPQRFWRAQSAVVNLYAYDVRQIGAETEGLSVAEPVVAIADWSSLPAIDSQVEISFLMVARDWTRLGEQQLLAEAIAYFAKHSELPEEGLVPALQGHGRIAIEIAQPLDVIALWRALEAPLQPALYLKVTVPLSQLAGCPQPAILPISPRSTQPRFWR
ncbi:MAG: Pvc16 family protein [Cyanobacteria bacterium P01_C01_bin.120]